MHRLCRWLFCFIVAAPAVSAHAQVPLTLAEAQRRAVERSRQLAAQDASVRSSREMAVAAGQLPDPVLKAGIDNLPVSGDDRFSLTRDFMTMRRIGIMQELTRNEKRQLRAQKFAREADRSEAEKQAATASIQRSTALAWLDRHYAEAMVEIVGAEIGQLKDEITAAEAAYRGGRGSQADVIAAYGTRAMLEDKASELRRKVAVAKANLGRWMGEGAELPLAPAPALDQVPLHPGTLEQALLKHPEMAVLVKQEEIAQTEAMLARASRRPDWTVELAYQQRGPAFSDMVSIGVSVPLPWDRANRQDREVAAKLAMAEQARAEREEMLRAHVAEVRAMLEEWQNGRERLARYEQELLPLARERTRATLAGYEGGRTSMTEVLVARRNEADTRLQSVQLEMDTARLWAQLNFLIPQGHAEHLQ